jgi:hypothetical protein
MPITIPDTAEIQTSVTEFREALHRDSVDLIVRRMLRQDNERCLNTQTRQEISAGICAEFHRTALDCVFVGSANVGFSIVEKPDKPRYRSFTSDSDVDIAIIDTTLFDQVWEEMFLRFIADRPWHDAQRFQKYFFRGWIRPDKLPFDSNFRSRWFDFFRIISRAHFDSAHSVNCGLYKSRVFLNEYHKLAVMKCRDAEEVR